MLEKKIPLRGWFPYGYQQVIGFVSETEKEVQEIEAVIKRTLRIYGQHKRPQPRSSMLKDALRSCEEKLERLEKPPPLIPRKRWEYELMGRLSYRLKGSF
ncbi:hypothetical protein K1719_018107 [Acacia pycnantha]|nr:hypothetical protein K1719_018107 [Acacia pycnantha]